MFASSELHPLAQADSTHTPIIRYRAYFFGPFRLFLDDQPLGEPWRRNKAKALLKWFLLNPGKLYSVDQLINLFWANFPPNTAIRNFHVTMHHLRHILEYSISPQKASSFIHCNRHNLYWFELHPSWWVDVIGIAHIYTTAREHDQRAEYSKAILLYQKIFDHCSLGFLPEDIYENAFTPYLRQYECMYMNILERLIHISTCQRSFSDILTYSHHALLLNPYCDLAMSAVVNAYLQQGNVAGAMCKLNDFLRQLKQDSNIEPSQELLTLKKKLVGTC